LKRGYNIKYRPYTFTEHGAIMAATALNRPQAVQMSVAVVHVFVKLSRMAFSVDGLQSLKDLFADDALMFSHGPQNAIQSAHAQAAMIGHGQAMMGRFFSFQDNVTADLVDLLVAPTPAQYFDQFRPLRSRGIFMP